jgi:hypothetical protein
MNENRMKNHNVCEMKYLYFNKMYYRQAEGSFVNTYKEYINAIKKRKLTYNTQTKYQELSILVLSSMTY